MGRNQKVSSESYRETSLKMAGRWVPHDTVISSLKKYSTTAMGHNTHIYSHCLEKSSTVDSNPTVPNEILLLLPQLDMKIT